MFWWKLRIVFSGIRYLRENENDLKEKEDFEAPQPHHYPPGGM